jgi:transcriptional regulator with XRE-family HTH domain
MTLAEVLKAELDSQGISLNALARAAGIPKSRAHAILTGVNPNPGLLTVEAILAGLGKSLTWLDRRRPR